VLVLLCSLLFASNLTWNQPLDSLELFAGVCSITRGDIKDLFTKRFK